MYNESELENLNCSELLELVSLPFNEVQAILRALENVEVSQEETPNVPIEVNSSEINSE